MLEVTGCDLQEAGGLARVQIVILNAEATGIVQGTRAWPVFLRSQIVTLDGEGGGIAGDASHGAWLRRNVLSTR